MKEAQRDVDALDLFKKDLTSFTRYYEFMSQIVDYDSTDLEKLSLYARHLAPQLREKTPDDDSIDLSSVELSHYRLSKIKQQRLRLVTTAETGLAPGDALGTGKPRNQEEEWLSQIIARMNELFSEGTANDKRNYLLTIRDKISENETVMQQIANNAPEQALLGDFPVALNNAVMDSGEAHQNLMEQYLSDPARQDGFRRLIFELLLASV